MKGNHLIIGGCGMVGAHLALNAFQESNIILVDDLSGVGSAERLQMIQKANPSAIFCQADACDTAAIEAIHEMAQKRLGGISSTVFAAGSPHSDTARQQPVRTIKIYSQGLMNAIEAHSRHSHYQPFIFISHYLTYGSSHPCIANTCKVDGQMGLQHINGLIELPADLEPNPDTLIGHCARHAEEILRWYCLRNKLRSTFCLRASMLYGDIFNESASDLIQYVVRCVYENQMVRLHFSPLSIMDPLRLEDLGALIVRLTEIDFPGHFFFQVGGGKAAAISLTKIMYTANDILGGNRKVDCDVLGVVEPQPNWYVSNLQAAHSLTDWKPRIQPIRGIQAILAQLRQNSK
jgi:nucleoside-diphosphate-sugar epimerase